MRARTLVLVTTLIALPAAAQPSRFQLGVGAGTLGGSVSASYRATSAIGLRVTLNSGSHTRNFQERDVNYDLTLHAQSLGGLVDLYPTGRSFRITGGALWNRNRVEGRTTENNVVTINDVHYPAALVGYITAEARGNRTAPYVGFGWAPSGRRWGVTFDVGVAYHGAPKLTAQAHPTIPQLVPASFYADLEEERVKEERDIAKYKWYPAVQLGLTFGF